MARGGQRQNLERVGDGTFAALVHAFKQHSRFQKYSLATRALWGRELDFAARDACLGRVTIAEIRPSLVQAFFDGIDDRPGKQAAAMAAVKQLEKWAVVRDLLPGSITLGVEIEPMVGGHIPWTAEQVAYAEANLPAHLSRAITLAAHTGQRGSDLIRMGWTDIETEGGIDGIVIRQQKTGRDVWIPITSTLAAVMKTWERRPGPFLKNAEGYRWTRKGLTDAWAYQRDKIALFASYRRCGPSKDTPLCLHGLRGHACVNLLRAGANTRQIADMVGMSEEMVATYTRNSVQRENATAAVYHLERTIKEREEKKA